MAGSITLDPYVTTNSETSFLLQSDGFVAGTYLDNPATRYQLEGGVVATAQATPLYGGLPLTLAVTAPGAGGASSGLGSAAVTATAAANLDAWCLMNGASAGVITPSSNVPLYPKNTSVNFARAGSGLWIVLPVNPTAVNTIAGGGSNQAIYWDYTNNYVDVTGTGVLPVQIILLNTNSKTISYSAGQANWTTGSVIVVRI